ncbi:MAG: four helix bundle protein [Ignavibacteriaceae bacterium]|jgi:four helix bundle protein
MGDCNNKYDLEDRLIQFSLLIIDIVEIMPSTKTGNHIAGQMIRSGTSPAFNYGEAQVAESRSDFIHKMKICLKELKETHIALQIIRRKPLVKDLPKVDKTITECKELISIFVKSVETARKNKSSKEI